MDAPDVQGWLVFELKGYPQKALSPEAITHARRVGRITDEVKLFGHWHPFAGLLAQVRAQEAELQSLKVPDVQFAPSSANPQEWVVGLYGQHVQAATGPATTALNRMAALTASIAELRGAVSKIMAALHEFVAVTYYELAFRGLAGSIFEFHKKQIDALLAASAGDTLQKIPAIAERLTAGEPEAVSNALTTCRRVLAAFADTLQPPTKEGLPHGDQTVEAGPEHYLNRLRYVIKQRCKSEHREKRLRHTLVNLNERCSAGTHADVSPQEAPALFVQLYVFLGEVLSLEPVSQGGAPMPTA